MQNITILATAYAINPNKGSEDGMGWNFILQIARFQKVIAVTRENNRSAIESYMELHPNVSYQHIQFLYFDLPPYQRFWKKGSRGAMLYYLLWQKALPTFVKKKQVQFDIVHNLNFHNDWTPSYVWKLNKPMVWGPIGHHPSIPTAYLKDYSWTVKTKEILTKKIKEYFWNHSRALKNTIRHTEHIFCMNKSVAEVLSIQHKKYTVMPSVAMTATVLKQAENKKTFTVISAGRMVALKGFDLTIRAFSAFAKSKPSGKEIQLKIIGSGPEKQLLQSIAKEEQISDQIQFIEWMDRKELMKEYENAAAFLFPSHEGAGMVVAEAMSYGLPVICLDNAGPGEFIDNNSGIAVPLGTYTETVQGLGQALHTLYSDPSVYKKLSEGARLRFEDYFDWDHRGNTLHQVYQSLT